VNAHNRCRDAAGDVVAPHGVGGEAGIAGVRQSCHFQQHFLRNRVAGRVQHREVMPGQARLAVEVIRANGPLPELLNERRGKPRNSVGAAIHADQTAEDTSGAVLIEMQRQEKHVAGGVRVIGRLPGPDQFGERGPVPQRCRGMAQAQGAACQRQRGIDGPDGGGFSLQERRGKLTASDREDHRCALVAQTGGQLICQAVRQRGLRQRPRCRAGVLPAVAGVQHHGDTVKRFDLGGNSGAGEWCGRRGVRPQPEPAQTEQERGTQAPQDVLWTQSDGGISFQEARTIRRRIWSVLSAGRRTRTAKSFAANAAWP